MSWRAACRSSSRTPRSQADHGIRAGSRNSGHGPVQAELPPVRPDEREQRREDLGVGVERSEADRHLRSPPAERACASGSRLRTRAQHERPSRRSQSSSDQPFSERARRSTISSAGSAGATGDSAGQGSSYSPKPAAVRRRAGSERQPPCPVGEEQVTDHLGGGPHALGVVASAGRPGGQAY